MNEQQEPWHLDKRVPVALIFTLMLQTAGIVWWAAGINERVGRLEDDARKSLSVDGRLIRLETQMSGVAEALSDAKATLRRIEEGLREGRN